VPPPLLPAAACTLWATSVTWIPVASSASVQPLGGVTPELPLLTATPPTSRAPAVCVVTAGTASVVAAVPLAAVTGVVSHGVVVLTPRYAAMPAFHFTPVDNVHVYGPASEAPTTCE